MGVPALFRWLSVKYPKIVEKIVDHRGKASNTTTTTNTISEKEQKFYEGGSYFPHSLIDIKGLDWNNPLGMDDDILFSYFDSALTKYEEENSYIFEPKPSSPLNDTDNLYLDMNGIIHPCCHPMNRPAPPHEGAMMLEIMAYIDHIFFLTTPKRTLFLAIDGVAPRAKMNQQRSRRFRAARDRKKKSSSSTSTINSTLSILPMENDSHNDEEFDYNCITPGTPFMALVSKSLAYYVKRRFNSSIFPSYLAVILSDANVPGEGEHKIVDWIRRSRRDPNYSPNTCHVIYGLDADLIMLAMATHEAHFRVLREDVFAVAQADNGSGSSNAATVTKPQSQMDFIFLNIATLTEYLEAELCPSSSTPFTLDRLVDDWIFLCFFVGNDFLPHLPSLELREGAVDLLLDIYKSLRKEGRLDGPLCCGGDVNLVRVAVLMKELAPLEDVIFRKRHEREERYSKDHQIGNNNDSSNEEVAAKLRGEPQIEREKVIKLWEKGSKELYYQEKLGLTPMDSLDPLIISYIEGLRWVMSYYFDGCPSWTWYYPYHYAPLASSLSGLASITKKPFVLGHPFRPYDQLMGVFPFDSATHIPEPFRVLMKEPSPIADFYPDDFVIDLNGKRHEWQGVALLPFIDENRLLNALNTIYEKKSLLTPQEEEMNRLGKDILFIRDFDHPSLLYFEPINPALHPSMISGSIMKKENEVFWYRFPFAERGQQYFPHLPSALPGVIRAPNRLSDREFMDQREGRGGQTRGRIVFYRGDNNANHRNGPYSHHGHSIHREHNQKWEERESSGSNKRPPALPPAPPPPSKYPAPDENPFATLLRPGPSTLKTSSIFRSGSRPSAPPPPPPQRK